MTPPTAVAAVDAVAECGAEPAGALARVYQAADRYRAAAAELEAWRQERQAAILYAKAAGANAHQIADAAGISDQRMSLILAKATRPRQPGREADFPLNGRSDYAATERRRAGLGCASGACGDILQRLIDADTFGGAHRAHLRSCQPCRTTTNQFAAITDFAHINALAPSPHVARSLALIVPGFSAPTSTAPLHD